MRVNGEMIKLKDLVFMSIAMDVFIPVFDVVIYNTD